MALAKLTIDKYLTNYAEPNSDLANHFDIPTLKSAIVIPAFNEDSRFITRLVSAPFVKDVLVICVVNQPQSMTSECASNNALWSLFCENMIQREKNIQYTQLGQLNILAIDQFTSGRRLSDKSGVGLARKIGCDIATSLFASGKLKNHVIFSTDADAILPNNYLAISNTPLNTSAYVFDFCHVNNHSEIAYATQKYELAIKYFRDGLSYAGSPYAYTSLGSALAFNILHYCQARGFPKRSGGEDFYLLNKLAKLGDIQSELAIQITIEPRVSERVPFGTGPAVKKIIENLNRGQPYLYFNPKIFVELKTLLDQHTLFFKAGKDDTQLSHTVMSALNDIEFLKFSIHAQSHCHSLEHFSKSFHEWFDAFKTLKFIRYLQTHNYPDIEINDCFKRAQKLFL